MGKVRSTFDCKFLKIIGHCPGFRPQDRPFGDLGVEIYYPYNIMSSSSVSSSSVSSSSVSSSSSIPPLNLVFSSSFNLTPVFDCAGAELKSWGDIGGFCCACCCAIIIIFAGSRGAPSPKGGMTGMTIFLYVIGVCCLSSSVNYMFSYFEHRAYLASASCAAISTSS